LLGLLVDKYARFKPRKLNTKQMRHEDTLRRRAQEIPVNIREFRIKVEGDSEGNENMDEDDLPLQPVPSAQGDPGGSFFELPLWPSSPNRGLSSGLISEMFIGFDSGLSGLAAPRIGSDVVMGKGNNPPANNNLSAGLVAPPLPPPPTTVADLVPDISVYANHPRLAALVGAEAFGWFQCVGNGDPQGPDHTGCDYYWVNDCYCVSPEVAHCIWCNHKLAISHLSCHIQCGECRHDKPPASFLS
jgi:hypothetical protein